VAFRFAAAAIAGPSDLEAMGTYRPEFVKGADDYDGWANVWPDFAHRAAEHYRERSAVYWANQITAPILIMHSRADRLVPVTQSLRMAQALQEAGRTYALHIYPSDWTLAAHESRGQESADHRVVQRSSSNDAVMHSRGQ
jgi:dipeptidyl aminopeptidase/acylaminoacyl peptidase